MVSEDELVSIRPHSLFVFEHEIYFTGQNMRTTGQLAGLFQRSKFPHDDDGKVTVIKGDIDLASPIVLYQENARPMSG